MMKQAAASTAPPTFDPTEGVQIFITNKDRAELLKSQSKSSVLLLPQKKQLLIRTFELQQEIFEKCTIFDAAYGSQLEVQLKNLMSKSANKIKIRTILKMIHSSLLKTCQHAAINLLYSKHRSRRIAIQR